LEDVILAASRYLHHQHASLVIVSQVEGVVYHTNTRQGASGRC